MDAENHEPSVCIITISNNFNMGEMAGILLVAKTEES